MPWLPTAHANSHAVKRPHVTYTYRFEQSVLEQLVGSSVEDVARRLSISAETVEYILEFQMATERTIPVARTGRTDGAHQQGNCRVEVVDPQAK